MKLNAALFSLLLVFLFSFSQALIAQDRVSGTPIMPSGGAQATSSYYQAIFDERGQALVLNRLEISNFGKTAMNDLTIEIPGSSVAFKYALQGIGVCSSQCAQYDKVCAQMRKVCDVWDYGQNTCTKWRDECQSYRNDCVRYEQRCNQNNYNDYSTSFKLIDIQAITGNTFKIKFQTPIESGQKGVLILSYRVFGYAKEGFTSEFDFQTLKAPFDIDHTRVAISVDKGLEIKGGATRTDYVASFNAFEGTLASASKSQAISGSNLGYASNIRYAAGYVKEKSNLLPNESFHVTGSYADAGWKLYIFEWLFWLALIIISLFLCWKFGWPLVASMFDSFFPPEAKKGSKAPEANPVRALTIAFVASAAFTVIFIFAVISIFIASAARFLPYNSSPVLLLIIILLALIAALGVFLFVNARYTVIEAIISVIAFIGFSIILIPVTLFVLYLLFAIFGMFGGGYFY